MDTTRPKERRVLRAPQPDDFLSSRWQVYDTEGRQARMVRTEAGGQFVLDAVSREVAVAVVNLHNAALRGEVR